MYLPKSLKLPFLPKYIRNDSTISNVNNKQASCINVVSEYERLTDFRTPIPNRINIQC